MQDSGQKAMLGLLPIAVRDVPTIYDAIGECVEIVLPWRQVFIPHTCKTSFAKEEIFHQKIGGSKPMFFETTSQLDDRVKWPKDSDHYPFRFIAQFLDPRPSHRHEFVRLFAADELAIDAGEAQAELKRFDLQSITKINIYDNVKAPKEIYAPPRIIQGWTHTWELAPNELRREVALKTHTDENSEVVDILLESVLEEFAANGFRMWPGFKVGGVGNTSQYASYTDAFVCNIYADRWGEGGSLHIMEDGSLVGDSLC
jgi:hypothetical protein